MSADVPLVPEAHFAYVTRQLIRLFNAGRLTNVDAIDVEPSYGYVARIHYVDGTYRITFGNDLGLNPGAAGELAKDKGHTKFLLRLMGVPCPRGREFLLPWWVDEIGPSQRKHGHNDLLTIGEAHNYVQAELGYPVYVKPVAGSKGQGVRRVDTRDELEAALADLDLARSRVAVVEEAIDLPDYRIVTLDGELISAYRRLPLRVVGDGESTIERLVALLQGRFDGEGRDTILHRADPRTERQLVKRGLTLDSVPAPGQSIVLAEISNLSAGGTSEDVTSTIHPAWVALAADIARQFNLRLCGTDLASADITSGDTTACVLEVNATPGLDHYASSGVEQQGIVDALYEKVLNTFPTQHRHVG